MMRYTLPALGAVIDARRTYRREASRSGLAIHGLILEILLIAVAGCFAVVTFRLVTTAATQRAERASTVHEHSIRRVFATSRNELWVRRGFNETFRIDASLSQPKQPIEWNNRKIIDMQISQDGRTCVLTSELAETLVLRDGEVVHFEAQQDGFSSFTTVAASGLLVAIGNDGNLIRCIELTEQEPLIRDLILDEPVERITLSDSGNYLVAVTLSGKVLIYAVETFQLLQTIHDVGRLMIAPQFSRDTAQLFLAQVNNIRLIDWKTQQEVWSFELAGFDEFRELSLSPDGKWVAASGYTPTLYLLKSQTGECIRTYTLPERSFGITTFACNSVEIYTGGYEGSISVWSIDHDQCVRKLAIP